MFSFTYEKETFVKILRKKITKVLYFLNKKNNDEKNKITKKYINSCVDSVFL